MSNEDLLNMLGAIAPVPVTAPTLRARGDGRCGHHRRQQGDVLTTLPAHRRWPARSCPIRLQRSTTARASIARWGGVLIGDDMGMGKTQVMLALIAARTGNGPAIVIAPPVTLAGWKGDLKAAFPGLNMFHAHGHTPQPIPAGTDIVFLSHDPLTLRAWLTDGLDSRKQFIISDLARSASIVCRDEAHCDKGANGKPGTPTSRARLMLTLGNALHDLGVPTIAATGTLLTNGRPIEMVIPMQFVGGKRLLFALAPGARTVYDFAAMYCAPKNNGFGMVYGCDRDKMPQLHALLRSTAMVRRDKDDLGAFLPARRWLIRPLALNGVLSRYNALARDVLAVIRQENGPQAYMRAARAERLVQIMKLWEEAGTAKAQAAVEYVTDLVDEGRPVVLFFQHGAALKITCRTACPRRRSPPVRSSAASRPRLGRTPLPTSRPVAPRSSSANSRPPVSA